ncbi:MAG: tetratricopeptide repeat protein [Flavobacteriales bacterium]|nr:tetratricopeptide repeat protein [Flavobacteriales bacterium]
MSLRLPFLVVLLCLSVDIKAQRSLDLSNDSLRILIADTSNVRWQIMGYCLLSTKYFQNQDSTSLFIKEAKKLAEKLNNPQVDAKILGTEGVIDLMTGRYDSAMACFEKTLQLGKDLHDSDMISTSLTNLGVIYQEKGDFAKAIEIQIQVLDIEKALGYESISAYTNIGGIYSQLLNSEQAFYYYHKAFGLCHKYDDRTGSIQTAMSLAAEHQFVGALDSAEHYNKIAFDRALEIDDDFNICKAQVNFGKIELSRGNYEQSMAWLRQAQLKTANSADDKLTMETFSNIGIVHGQLGNHDSALYYLKEPNDYFKKENFLELRMIVLEGIVNAHRGKNNLKKAILFNDTLNIVRDSLFSKNKYLIFQNAESKFQNEKLRAEKAEGEKKVLQVKQENDRQKVFLLILGISIAVVTIFGLVFLLLAYRRKLQLQKQKIETERELTKLEQNALKAQINTHFIFNALDLVRSYLNLNQIEEAKNHIGEVAKLIRLILENASEPTISLEDEINCLRTYLKICHRLFNRSFDYDVHIANEIDSSKISIPPLLLQPLLENAIIHGRGNSEEEEKNKITLEFNMKDELLQCKVSNDTQNEQESRFHELKRKSMGMEITQTRLENYNAQFDIQSNLSKENEEGRITVSFQVYAEQSY